MFPLYFLVADTKYKVHGPRTNKSDSDFNPMDYKEIERSVKGGIVEEIYLFKNQFWH